ncbi:DUF6572 domain-containing protein [Streptococcus suis]|uniref:DUF6572 domain-containing protein n=1 Tax=Streptococcus suis TaxID=1307 RepID=UPI000CF4C1C2|nr:DUF6572 domain-containing protein [Streptococcus suis]HEM6072110.1 hypothetical protein [Streptococcus suis]HEM6184935.1 hypothetical protein [Streptococcus suis]
MELVHISKKDILEIYKDEDKYILKYPTFNITMPEVVKEVSKEAVDSYLAGEHTGEELITYANYGFWKPKNHLTQEESNRNFLRNHPQLIFKNIENNRRLFSKEEFEELLAKAHELSKPKVLLEVTTIDSLGIVDGHLELLLADGNAWLPDTEQDHLLKLQEKLNNYIHFIESKQYVGSYGDDFTEKVINLTFQYPPSDNGLAFLVQVQKVLQPTDIRLKVVVPE